MSTSERANRRIGCIIGLVVVLLMVAGEILYFVGTVRVPTEIPVGDLVEAQSRALGEDWRLAPGSEVYTDSDFTSAAWMLWNRYDYADLQHYLAQELHVFRGPSQAIRSLSPSPMAVNINQAGRLPPGWTYVPPHADRFVLDCTPEPLPEGCYVLLVYQEYSLVLAVDIAGAMSLDSLEQLLHATDDFMAKYLASTHLERGRRQVQTLSELGLAERQ